MVSTVGWGDGRTCCRDAGLPENNDRISECESSGGTPTLRIECGFDDCKAEIRPEQKSESPAWQESVVMARRPWYSCQEL